jgi:uncharacterized protein YfiM (DUF2279 family)
MSKILAETLLAASISGCGVDEVPSPNRVAALAQAGAAAPAPEEVSRATATPEPVCPNATVLDGKTCSRSISFEKDTRRM